MASMALVAPLHVRGLEFITSSTFMSIICTMEALSIVGGDCCALYSSRQGVESGDCFRGEEVLELGAAVASAANLRQ